MRALCGLVVLVIAFPALTLAQVSKPAPGSPELQRKREEEQIEQALRRSQTIQMVKSTAAEAPLWDDKKTAVLVLTDAADLLWDEAPGQGSKWLTRAWTLIDQVSESARNEKLKEFFTRSDKSDLRARLLSVARKHDEQLAETFLTQLSRPEPDEKKDRGAFDDKSARSEQLLSLAQRAVDDHPDLAVTLAERSLVDGISYSLQNVLTGLRTKNIALSNRLFDSALARLSFGAPDPSEAEVLAGYLFQSGFTFSANSAGQALLVVNPAHQTLPAVAPSEPQRAKNFLIAVYQVLLSRPISADTPEGKQRGQRLLVLGQRLAGLYDTFAPEVAQSAQGFLAQLQREFAADGQTQTIDRATTAAATNENSTKHLTREEIYDKHLTGLEAKANQETNPILKKLAYVEAALAAKPEDYERARRIAEKIDDDNLRADAISFVLYRGALFLVEKTEIEKAVDLALQITDVSRRSVVRIAIAQRLLASRNQKSRPGEKTLEQQRAFDLLSDIERDLKRMGPSPTAAKILLGRAAVLAKLDQDQALASLEETILMINGLEKFDLRDSAAPNLSLGTFSASAATVGGPRIGFDFRSAIDPLIDADFEQVLAIAGRFTGKEQSGVARLETAKLYLRKNGNSIVKESTAAVR